MHNHASFMQSDLAFLKKKKKNKMLCEIVGVENKHKLDLRLNSATRFFDNDEEKMAINEVIV
jgi:hypothetical protein